MKKYSPLITGTLLLTAAGIFTKILGFIYRIFLSRLAGAEGMGIYQLIFPIFGICLALCSAPIQTSISKFTAEDSIESVRTIRYFRCGMFLSIGASLLCSLILWFFADEIATHFLLEPRCSSLLKVMALGIPGNAIHSSICGYYYGRSKTGIPAGSQLVEQVSRMAFIYLYALYLETSGQSFPLEATAAALAIGEICSMLFTLGAVRLHFHRVKPLTDCVLPGRRKTISHMLHMAVPLSGNRLTLSILTSMEAIMVPSRLQMWGLNTSQALGIYGVFSGMALPFILFPSALTSAFALMLLPNVAQAQSLNQEDRISRTTNYTRDYCLYLGILCTATFLVLGEHMGNVFFPGTSAGYYITCLAWICPFMYLTTTFTSINNGLGKTSLTFCYQLSGTIVRLIFVVFLIPLIGIRAWFIGLLASQLLTCLLNYYSLKQSLELYMDAVYVLARPMTIAVISILMFHRVQLWFLQHASELTVLAAGCALISICYLSLMLLTRRKSDR